MDNEQIVETVKKGIYKILKEETGREFQDIEEAKKFIKHIYSVTTGKIDEQAIKEHGEKNRQEYEQKLVALDEKYKEVFEKEANERKVYEDYFKAAGLNMELVKPEVLSEYVRGITSPDMAPTPYQDMKEDKQQLESLAVQAKTGNIKAGEALVSKLLNL